VIAALRDEFERRLNHHGISNGNFMLVAPGEMRRWRDDLTAALAPDDEPATDLARYESPPPIRLWDGYPDEDDE
jgi:hypothetical protein